MKKLLKSIIVFFATVSFATATPIKVPTTKCSESFKVGMYNVQNSFVIRLFIEKMTCDDIKIELKNKNGTPLFSKFMGKKEAIKCFNIDMSNLESANYTLEISNGKELMVKNLNLKQGETVVLDKKIVF